MIPQKKQNIYSALKSWQKGQLNLLHWNRNRKE